MGENRRAGLLVVQEQGFILGLKTLSLLQTDPQSPGYSPDAVPFVITRLMGDAAFQRELVHRMSEAKPVPADGADE